MIKNIRHNDIFEDTVQYEDICISYRFYCSRQRRTLAMSVYPDRSIVVRAPYRTSRETIRQFVLLRRLWILKVWKKFEKHLPERPSTYLTGDIHHYAGKEHVLEVKKGSADSVACFSGRIIVTTRYEPNVSKTKKLLHSWFRTRAEILFNDRLMFCHEVAKQEGIPIPELRIRKMRSRWGSYSSKGIVTLNLLLIMTPVECLDYVILHELCHNKVGGHGPPFWALLTRMLPDWRQRKLKLNSYVAYLIGT
jgi:predicted metal-dependent hydrolase